MKKLLALAAVASVTAFAAPAFADSSASLGWSEWSIADFDANTLTATGSWNRGHFGVQAEGAWGVAQTRYNNSFSGQKDIINIRSELGLFATAQLDVADNLTIGARAGVANVNAKERNATTNTHHIDTNGGAAYGANVTWMFSGSNGVRLDYTQYKVGLGKDPVGIGFPPSFSNEDPSVLTLSLVHKFGGAAPAAAAPAAK
ncbi:MAG: outer membrane beta-barrel protein [Alphaproteobacteria bacterium]